jgi:uncharacterized protein YdgA (DUF945 family)
MRKLLTGTVLVFVLLLAAYGISSYWVGTQAQKQYDLLLARASQNHSTEATTKSYQRGIFHSKAVTTIHVNGTTAEAGRTVAYEFNIVNSIQHGPLAMLKGAHAKNGIRPVIAVISTHLAPADENPAQLKEFFKKFPELESSEILTVLSFDGSGESFFDVPAFRKQLVEQTGAETTLDWGGFSSSATFDVALGEVSGSFQAPFLEVGENGGRFRVKEIKGDFNAHPGVKGLSVGEMSISSNNIEASSNEGKPVFLLESPGIQMETGVSGETIHGSFLARFEKLSAGGDVYGPFTFDLDANKLDPAAIARFQENLKVLQDQMSNKSEEELKSGFASCYKQFLIDLLAKSPEVELKQVSIKTSRGDLTGKLKIGVSGPAGEMSGNILFLLANLSASADVVVSEPLFFFLMENSLRSELASENRSDSQELQKAAGEKAAAVVETLLAQNFIQRDKGSFKTSASYKSGKVTINGRKLNIMDLLKSPLPE